MLLRRLLDLLQMFIITVLGEPCDDILVRPVDLKRMVVIIVDVVLFIEI